MGGRVPLLLPAGSPIHPLLGPRPPPVAPPHKPPGTRMVVDDFLSRLGGKLVVSRRGPRRGGMWWGGGVLGTAAGKGVNTQLPGDRHSCQIISGRTIGRVIR